MLKIKEYYKNLMSIIKKREMRILPGNLAFYLILTIVPLTTLVSFICSSFSISMENIISFLTRFMPVEVSNIITPLFTNSNAVNISFVMMIVGFFIASNGTHSIIIVSNTLYHIEDRNYLSRRIKALLMLIWLMIIFVFTLIFIGFGNIILKILLNLNIITNYSTYIYQILIYLKYPISFILTYFFIKTTYIIAPDDKIKNNTVNKGALFTTIGWIFVTVIYSYYANKIANYDLWYGGLSNIIVLMVWIYIISYIFVVGIAINANEYNYLKNNE